MVIKYLHKTKQASYRSLPWELWIEISSYLCIAQAIELICTCKYLCIPLKSRLECLPLECRVTTYNKQVRILMDYNKLSFYKLYRYTGSNINYAIDPLYLCVQNNQVILSIPQFLDIVRYYAIRKSKHTNYTKLKDRTSKTDINLYKLFLLHGDLIHNIVADKIVTAFQTSLALRYQVNIIH